MQLLVDLLEIQQSQIKDTTGNLASQYQILFFHFRQDDQDNHQIELQVVQLQEDFYLQLHEGDYEF